MSCLLWHVFERKIQLRIEVTGDEEEDIRILSEGYGRVWT
jgi:hypothetical protein